MRILIVGAGIAGMSLAALLKQRGVDPVIIDKAPDFEHNGYMLGLYPLGSRILHGLNLYPQYLSISYPTNHYQMCNSRGNQIKVFELSDIEQKIGEYRMISRPEIVSLLHQGIRDIDLRMNTQITQLEQNEQEVRIIYHDNKQENFDIVIGADGIHSTMRELLFGPSPYYNTGWGGYVWWVDNSLIDPDIINEYWGAGYLLGVYPTRERTGVIACMPTCESYIGVKAGRKAYVLKKFAKLQERAGSILNAMPDDSEDLFYWRLSDTRAPEWSQGRVVLLGDAAAAFLPTAGVGASMAMESAAVLNDELSRVDTKHIPAAIDLYTKRRKKRVLAVQEESRKLARMMFLKSPPLTWIRNQMMRFVTTESLIKNISKSMREPI